MADEDLDIDEGSIDTSAEEGMSDGADSTIGTDTADSATDGTAGSESQRTTGETADGGTQTPASEASTRKRSSGDKSTTSVNIPGRRQTTTQNGQQPPVNWQKRFQDESAGWGRQRQQFETQLQTLQRQTAEFQQREQQRQQEAARLQLRRWDPGHPQHGDFRTLMGKAQGLRAQMRAVDERQDIPPEAKVALKQEISRILQPEEAKELQEHEKMREEFLTNPQGAISNMIRQTVPQIIAHQFQEYQRYQQAQQEVNQVMQDQDFITRHGEAIKARLSRGENYQAVMIDLRKSDEIAALKAQLAKHNGTTDQVSREAAANKERQRLAKGNADTTRRDPKAIASMNTIYDEALKVAKERGITDENSEKFRKILRDLEAARTA